MKGPLTFDKRRFRVKSCPCGKSNKDGKFVPYQEYENKGYCHSCDRTFLPNDGTLADPKNLVKPKPRFKPKEPSFHGSDLQDEIIRTYNTQSHNCNLTSFLLKCFLKDEVENAANDYCLTGTNHFWPNSTIFWQMDDADRIHAGKIMLYSPDTGKRVKEPYNHVNWLHNALKIPDFILEQCLFGLHLVKHRPQDRIGIVESEKTAILMSVIVPDMVWLATGSKQNLKPQLLSPLRGRELILYPDRGEYLDWKAKSEELREKVGKIMVSRLLEEPQGYPKGYDLADLYLNDRTKNKIA